MTKTKRETSAGGQRQLKLKKETLKGLSVRELLVPDDQHLLIKAAGSCSRCGCGTGRQ